MRKTMAALLRWLHVYLSMISFAVVLFFAATGITLNHPGWFENQQKTTMLHGQVARALLMSAANGSYEPLRLVEQLRQSEHLHGAPADLRIDEMQISFSLRAPGYSADALVDRASGRYDITVNSFGLVAVLNDLHKGRDSGRAWGWLIDLSGALLVVVSLSGLGLIWFIYKRRAAGLLLALLGIVAPCALYLFLLR